MNNLLLSSDLKRHRETEIEVGVQSYVVRLLILDILVEIAIVARGAVLATEWKTRWFEGQFQVGVQ